MTWGMVGDSRFVVLLEDQLDFFLFNQSVYEPGSEFYIIPDIRVVNTQEMRVLVPDREVAG